MRSRKTATRVSGASRRCSRTRSTSRCSRTSSAVRVGSAWSKWPAPRCRSAWWPCRAATPPARARSAATCTSGAATGARCRRSRIERRSRIDVRGGVATPHTDRRAKYQHVQARPRLCRGFACKGWYLASRSVCGVATPPRTSIRLRRSILDRLHLAPVAAPEVHVAAERALAGGVAALHGHRALRQRGAGHLDHAEPTLAALDVLEHLEVDLVREHLLDAPEKRVAVFLERIEETAVHAETGRRVDDLLALCRAICTVKMRPTKPSAP